MSFSVKDELFSNSEVMELMELTVQRSCFFLGANSAGVDLSNRVEFSHLPAVDVAKAREVLQPGEDGVWLDVFFSLNKCLNVYLTLTFVEFICVKI